jgi:hypothetical protein
MRQAEYSESLAVDRRLAQQVKSLATVVNNHYCVEQLLGIHSESLLVGPRISRLVVPKHSLKLFAAPRTMTSLSG